VNELNIDIREYLLGLLEEGILGEGGKLPPARDIAKRFDVSFQWVQREIDQLVHAGLFYSVPRRGIFARSDWQERQLPYVFKIPGDFPADIGLAARFRGAHLPVHISRKFRRGSFELQVSYRVMSLHEEYEDISSLYREMLPEGEGFSERFFQNFSVNGRCCGLPIIFSPRVIFLNAGLFRKHGVPVPGPDWTWDDLQRIAAALRKDLRPEQLLNWSDASYFLLSFLVANGGAILSDDEQGRVRLDESESLEAIRFLARLYETMGGPPMTCEYNYLDGFAGGNLAMLFGQRQSLYKLHSGKLPFEMIVRPLPAPPGGEKPFRSMVSGEFFCIRRNFADLDTAKHCLSVLLAPEFQQEMGRKGYGIPVLRSAALATLSPEDPMDGTFLSEIPRMKCRYNLLSPELHRFACSGIGAICSGSPSRAEAATRELAQALRLFIRYSRKTSK